MTIKTEPKTPQAVSNAEKALWVWTAWTCLFGIYQSWVSIPEIEEMLTGQLQGLFVIEPKQLLEWIIAGYAGLFAASAWVVHKIGAGRNWARKSLVWGFVIEVLYTAWPPYHLGIDALAGIPDFGLQAYALYLLYTKSGDDWFQRVE